MKKLFIVANWKSYKTIKEAQEWVMSFPTKKILPETPLSPASSLKHTVVCAPFTVLSILHQAITEKHLSVALGAEDISPFDEGAFTGAINGKQLKELVEYVLIGHSERRSYFGESLQLLTQKVQMAQKYGIIPIYCVQNDQEQIPQGVEIVAYEPVFAIGTGKTDTPENANAVARSLKAKYNVRYVLYGGSVNSGNVASFTNQDHLDGVLVGSASLSAPEFMQLIDHA